MVQINFMAIQSELLFVNLYFLKNIVTIKPFKLYINANSIFINHKIINKTKESEIFVSLILFEIC